MHHFTFNKEYVIIPSCHYDHLGGTKELVELTGAKTFIGNHVWNNDTFGKYKRMVAGEKDAFVDSSEWKRFLEKCAKNVKALEL